MRTEHLCDYLLLALFPLVARKLNRPLAYFSVEQLSSEIEWLSGQEKIDHALLFSTRSTKPHVCAEHPFDLSSIMLIFTRKVKR